MGESLGGLFPKSPTGGTQLCGPAGGEAQAEVLPLDACCCSSAAAGPLAASGHPQPGQGWGAHQPLLPQGGTTQMGSGLRFWQPLSSLLAVFRPPESQSVAHSPPILPQMVPDPSLCHTHAAPAVSPQGSLGAKPQVMQTRSVGHEALVLQEGCTTEQSLLDGESVLDTCLVLPRLISPLLSCSLGPPWATPGSTSQEQEGLRARASLPWSRSRRVHRDPTDT